MGTWPLPVGEIQQPGRLDRKLEIQQLTQGQDDDYGKPTKAWSTWVTVWGSRLAEDGKEFYRARQVSAEIDAIFQIHYRSGLLATMRIICEGITYDIYRIQEVGRQSRLNIWAKARQT